jgi:hypothetical protein
LVVRTDAQRLHLGSATRRTSITIFAVFTASGAIFALFAARRAIFAASRAVFTLFAAILAIVTTLTRLGRPILTGRSLGATVLANENRASTELSIVQKTNSALSVLNVLILHKGKPLRVSLTSLGKVHGNHRTRLGHHLLQLLLRHLEVKVAHVHLRRRHYRSKSMD